MSADTELSSLCESNVLILLIETGEVVVDLKASRAWWPQTEASLTRSHAYAIGCIFLKHAILIKDFNILQTSPYIKATQSEMFTGCINKAEQTNPISKLRCSSVHITRPWPSTP